MTAKIIFAVTLSRPSLTSTPSVTAGLKCPPDTFPKIAIAQKIVKPTAIG